VIYLDVPREHIVLLQSFFELYDGVGTVRTVQSAARVVCVMTTESQLATSLAVLEGIREIIHWRLVECNDDPLL
jgi:hypothetical protein